MEQDIIDELQEEIEPQEIVYAKFWTRVKASVIDAVILAPVTYGLAFYILIYVKSLFLILCIALVPPLYKCFMEKTYGATFGKILMHIYVVSESFEELTYKAVCIRNYYFILSLIMGLIGYYLLHEMPEFQEATTLSQVWTLLSDKTILQKTVRYTITGIFYIDNLLMFKSDRNQTLHDRLAKTVVLKVT